MSDVKNYNEIIDEILVRVEERHGIMLELKKIVSENVLEEALADLKAAEESDFAEIGRLMQMAHGASARAGEKSKIMKKLKKF
ncbi:hypothetical protein CTI12_AA313460 [Artemisia annua]|uniref:Uncharacterized protein n=1 Tax=Artemisia annua TaxID=35608 RepID=A0A2U1N364_ARTAN|nr:hypothetical protein CTI12_AA313460 [Artemisia annua]